MRTPIASCIFFIAQTLRFLQQYDIEQRVLHNLKLVDSQLKFILSFVDDLLDLRQLRDGIFNLKNAPFNPNEVFEEILNIFSP